MIANKATIKRATVANLELSYKIGSGLLSFGLFFVIRISEAAGISAKEKQTLPGFCWDVCCAACASWALFPRGRVPPCGRADGSRVSCPLLALPEQTPTLCGSPEVDAQNPCTHLLCWQQHHFLSCFSTAGTVAAPSAATTSLLLPPFCLGFHWCKPGVG